jgi:hypothetical protein
LKWPTGVEKFDETFGKQILTWFLWKLGCG